MEHKYLTARFEFVRQDMWVGVFWKRQHRTWTDFDDQGVCFYIPVIERNVWICLLPCLPLHLEWYQFPKDYPPFRMK